MMADQQDVLAKPLPTPVAPSGKGRVGFKEAIGVQQPFLARQAEIQPEIAKAEADIAKGQQEQKEIKSTGELSAQMRFGQQQEAAMTGLQEKIEKEPLPAFIPSKDTAQDIAGLFGVISVISMLVGGGGRMSGQLALGNMNGMMEGYRKGRKDLYEKERSEFDKNFKSMIQKHAEFRQEMEDAIKLAATNKEEGFRAAEMAAVKAGSPIVQAQLRKGDLLGAYKLVDESQKGSQHALQMEQKAREQEEAQKFRKEQAKQAADLKAALAGGRRDEKILQSIGPALRNIAEQYPEGTAISLAGASPDDKKRVQGAYRAVEESEKVADFVARNPNAVGALAVAKNFLRVDAIKSLQSEDESTVAASKAAVIDQQLDEGVQKGQISKDDAEAAKFLQKKLFALALADVQGSGQRGSVYLDRQFQNLYDQASRDTTLVKIIRERAEENNRNLKTYKLNIERNNNPEQFPLVEARSVEDYMKERKPKSGVPDNVEKALKGKPEASGVKSGGKTYRIYGGVVKEVQE
jgi:hypothetical protein